MLETNETSKSFNDILTGKSYERTKKYDKNVAYGEIKGIAALYLSEFARIHPEVYVATISPGGTTGTNFKDAESVSKIERMMFTFVMGMFGKLGKFHALEVGAKRYVDGVTGENGYDHFVTGTFVASKKGVNGPVSDQATYKYGKAYGNRQIQHAAYQAVHSFA